MASIIRVKRSTGTVAPPSLNYGELGLTVGVGTHGNNGGRLFAGDNSSNAQIIGGRYYADLLSIAPGLVAGQSNPTTPSNGFVAILDQNRKVDEWNVDNITIDGNTLSSTNTDGDINIDPNGSGEVSIPDDTYLSFGTSKDTKFRYDESTNDRFEVEGADWYYSSGVSITIDDTTASTSPSTGALVVTGGVGFGTDLNVGGSVDIDLDLNVDGGSITSNSLTFNFLNVNVTSANILGAGTTIVIGSTSGITTIQNEVVSFNNSSNSSYVSVAATTDATSTTTGALRVAGGAGIEGNIHIGGDLYVTGGSYIVGVTTFINDVDITQNLAVDGNVTLGNGANDKILITGITTFIGDINQVGQFVNSGGVIIDNIGISSNVISTKSGGSNKLFIDPYPDGLSNEGTVIIKGDLQVDGNTTTVNSSTVTVNEPILVLGDVTSARTVMETVQVGVTTIRLDSIVGINNPAGSFTS